MKIRKQQKQLVVGIPKRVVDKLDLKAGQEVIVEHAVNDTIKLRVMRDRNNA